MKILKYKDGQGNWVSVPALIGPKGDKGDDGEKGDKGDRGDTVIIASKYSELTFPVAEGTYCLYNDVPYVANQAISTSEAWTAAHWDQVSFEDEIGELKNALNALDSSAVKSVNGIDPDENGNVEIEIADPEEINSTVGDWLDDHPEATTTVDFSIATKVFPTVSDMVADLTLKSGDNIATRGYYASGDGGGANYVISSSHTGAFYITLNNSLYANRASEKGFIRAESIGIKAYSTETDSPSADDMENNVVLFQRAIDSRIFVEFGVGHYYFNSSVHIRTMNTGRMRGIDRAYSVLHFPSSDGMVFDTTMYYNYWVFDNFAVKAYGNSIIVEENVPALVDCVFSRLMLSSETGCCFVAPTYNVAKYTGQGGQTIYDTCVQNNVFEFINGNAGTGAVFKNITGQGNIFRNINVISSLYGFQNCDGRIEDVNTLGGAIIHMIYYDQVNTHSLRLILNRMNAEGVLGSFIFSEPEVAVPAGEDPKKPTSKVVQMTINSLYALNSSMTLSGSIPDGSHTIYPVTVSCINQAFLINSDNLFKPSAYPSKYDTSVVKANVRSRRASSFVNGYTGPDIKQKYDNTNNPIFVYGNKDRKVISATDAGVYNEVGLEQIPFYDMFGSWRLFGGKALQVYSRTISSGDVISVNDAFIPEQYRYCDVVDLKITNTSSNAMQLVNWYPYEQYPGRIKIFKNNNDSTRNLTLVSMYTTGSGSFDLGTNITLRPGECVQLMLMVTAGKILRWRPLYGVGQVTNSMLYSLVKDLHSLNTIAFTKGGYIATNGETVDINAIQTSNGTYRYAVVTCQENDIFTIINGYGGASPRLWAFIDSSGNRLTVSNENVYAESLRITAPQNADKLIVNTQNESILYKVT